MRRGFLFVLSIFAAGGLSACATTSASPSQAAPSGQAPASRTSDVRGPGGIGVGVTDEDDTLTQKHSSPNGLILTHYPASFAAKEINEAGLLLARDLQDGRDEAVMLIAIDDPISNDVDEFARVMFAAQTKSLNNYNESSRTKSTWGGLPAVEILGTWTPEKDTRPVTLHGWAFVRNNHGYMFGYMAFQTDLEGQEPILRKILDAVDFVK